MKFYKVSDKEVMAVGFSHVLHRLREDAGYIYTFYEVTEYTKLPKAAPTDCIPELAMLFDSFRMIYDVNNSELVACYVEVRGEPTA